MDSENIYCTHGNLGASEALIAIHGSGGDHSHWPEALTALTGFDTYCMDLPGHGRSSGKGRKTVPSYGEFVGRFVSALGAEEVTLMGHSLGGAIVLQMALWAPEWLKRIILVGTGARLRVMPEILEGLETDYGNTVDALCRYCFGPNASETKISKIRKGFLNMRSEIVRGDFMACDQFDIMEMVDKILFPALVVSGRLDRMTPVKYGEYLERHIPGAAHAIIEDAGHMMGVEKPEALVEAVQAFLNG